MPGVTVTNFQDNSGSSEALIWRLPLLSMEADEASSSSAFQVFKSNIYNELQTCLDVTSFVFVVRCCDVVQQRSILFNTRSTRNRLNPYFCHCTSNLRTSRHQLQSRTTAQHCDCDCDCDDDCGRAADMTFNAKCTHSVGFAADLFVVVELY